jgi:hypothetical protein
VFERGLYFSADFIVQSRSFEVIQVVEEIGKDVLAEVIEGPEFRSSRIVNSAWLGLLDTFFDFILVFGCHYDPSRGGRKKYSRGYYPH